MNLLQLFEQDQRRRALSENTIAMRDRQLKLYEREVGPMVGATKAAIANFLDSRKKRDGGPISAKTRSCYLTTFSSFFTWGVEAELISVINPVTKSMRPKVHLGLPNPIPEADYARAIAAAKSPMMTCWLMLERYAGLRCQEVAFLSREDILLEDGSIRVTHGKGGKERIVPLSLKIVTALMEYEMPTHGRLWPDATPSSVSQRINRHLHALGITHTAHKLRHRFATSVLKTSEKDLLTVKNLLGHSSVATTQIYAQVDDEDARKAVMAL